VHWRLISLHRRRASASDDQNLHHNRSVAASIPTLKTEPQAEGGGPTQDDVRARQDENGVLVEHLRDGETPAVGQQVVSGNSDRMGQQEVMSGNGDHTMLRWGDGRTQSAKLVLVSAHVKCLGDGRTPSLRLVLVSAHAKKSVIDNSGAEVISGAWMSGGSTWPQAAVTVHEPVTYGVERTVNDGGKYFAEPCLVLGDTLYSGLREGEFGSISLLYLQ
jgi:hypothetical protein